MIFISWHMLTYSFCSEVKWALSNNREECTKKKKIHKWTEKKNQSRDHIKIPAHLENTGMLDNKKKKISQEDEVQWSVAVQPSVGERLSSETLWCLHFFHLATQTNCMFKLFNGFLNCHAVCLKSDLMLCWMTPWKQKWALSVSSFNIPVLIFSQFCETERKKQNKKPSVKTHRSMYSTAYLSQSTHKVDHAFKCTPFKNKQNVLWQEHGGTLMTNGSHLDDAHLDSWTQNMSVKQTTAEGLLKWWCGYGCSGHGWDEWEAN